MPSTHSAPDGYPPGSCTRFVYGQLPWVPLRWGDAYQWTESAREAGLTVADWPALFAVAVFDRWGRYGERGHVAVVADVLAEKRWSAQDTHSWRTLRGTVSLVGRWKVDGFILPPADPYHRLPDGTRHNGAGAATPNVDRVSSDWDTMADYWQSRLPQQVASALSLAGTVNRIP